MRKHINRSQARKDIPLLVVALFDALRGAPWGCKLDAMDDMCQFYWLAFFPYVRFTYPKLFRLIAWVLVGR